MPLDDYISLVDVQKNTPLYVYDLNLLNKTIQTCLAHKGSYHIHYAIKANSNPELLKSIKAYNLNIDCVSANEIRAAQRAGFGVNQIVFAGVGKTDQEIIYALKSDIQSINVESVEELKIINALGSSINKTAKISLRINPNTDAQTHKNITTGLKHNKFGISVVDLYEALDIIRSSPNLEFLGLHFHIGSQISDLTVFKNLSDKINLISEIVYNKSFRPQTINVGGGLGIDYDNPIENPIAPFKEYFEIFKKNLKVDLNSQQVLFELGRSLVGQCGTLVTRVLFIKKTDDIHTAIVDAGMTELLRPSLYGSYHKISLLGHGARQEKRENKKYNIVGPICESSDCFATGILLPELKRGDLLCIHSTGAYAESMSLNYNLRDKAKSLYIAG